MINPVKNNKKIQHFLYYGCLRILTYSETLDFIQKMIYVQVVQSIN